MELELPSDISACGGAASRSRAGALHTVVKPESAQMCLRRVPADCRETAALQAAVRPRISSDSCISSVFISTTYKAKNAIWKSVKNNQAQKLLLDCLWQVPQSVGE